MTALRFPRVFLPLALGAALLLACPPLRAATPSPTSPAGTAGTADPGEQPTFRAIGVDFPQITVRVKLVASATLDLTPDSFRLTENGTPVEGFFLASATPRFFLTLLLDRSSSVESVMGDIKRSAAGFLKSLPPETRISLMSFGSDTDITVDFTTDRRALIEGIKGLRPWGGTALYDALHLACEQLYANSDPRDLRTIVVFTDGRDETPALRTQMSIKNLPEVLQLADRHLIRLITVGMGTEIDRGILKQMARETNGWECYAPTARELYGIYESISRAIRRERHFVLHYLTPHPERDGARRTVDLAVRLPGKETVDGQAVYEAPVRRGGIRPLPPLPPADGEPGPGNGPDAGTNLEPGPDLAPPDLAPATPGPPDPPRKPTGPKILE